MSELMQRHEPAASNIYEDDKSGEMYQALYVDTDVVLLRSNDPGRNERNVHRLERRKMFDDMVESGQFEYKPDSDLDLMDLNKQDWTDVSHIGSKTAENLYAAGIETKLDVEQATEEELLAIDGLGAMGLAKLDEYIR